MVNRHIKMNTLSKLLDSISFENTLEKIHYTTYMKL